MCRAVLVCLLGELQTKNGAKAYRFDSCARKQVLALKIGICLVKAIESFIEFGPPTNVLGQLSFSSV